MQMCLAEPEKSATLNKRSFLTGLFKKVCVNLLVRRLTSQRLMPTSC